MDDYLWCVVDRFHMPKLKYTPDRMTFLYESRIIKAKKVKMVKIQERRIKPAVQQEKIFVAHTTIWFPMK